MPCKLEMIKANSCGSQNLLRHKNQSVSIPVHQKYDIKSLQINSYTGAEPQTTRAMASTTSNRIQRLKSKQYFKKTNDIYNHPLAKENLHQGSDGNKEIDYFETGILESERSHNIESALSNFYSKDKIIDKMKVLNKMKSINGINLINSRRRISSQQIKQRFAVKTIKIGHEQMEQLSSTRKIKKNKGMNKMLTERNLKNQIQVAKYFRNVSLKLDKNARI